MFEKTIEYIVELGKRGDLIHDEEALVWLAIERGDLVYRTTEVLIYFISYIIGASEYTVSFERNYMDEDGYTDFDSFFKSLKKKFAEGQISELGSTNEILNYLITVIDHMRMTDLDEIISMSALDINEITVRLIKDTPQIFEFGSFQLFFDDSYILGWLKPIIEKSHKLKIGYDPIQIIYFFWTIHLYYLLSNKIFYKSRKDKIPQLPFVYDYRIQRIVYQMLLMAGQEIQLHRGLAKKSARLFRSKRSLTTRVSLRQKEVIKLYNGIDTYERKPYAIANLIHQEMSKKMQEVPTVRTIREDLRKLGLC